MPFHRSDDDTAPAPPATATAAVTKAAATSRRSTLRLMAPDGIGAPLWVGGSRWVSAPVARGSTAGRPAVDRAVDRSQGVARDRGFSAQHDQATDLEPVLGEVPGGGGVNRQPRREQRQRAHAA